MLEEKKSGPITVLVVGRATHCQEIRSTLCGSEEHEVVEATTCEEAENLLNKKEVTVVLCENNLNWQSILGQAMKTKNKASVIVCGRHVDERSWAEALSTGAHDVLLVQPTARDDLFHVIKSAYLSCKFGLQPTPKEIEPN